MKQKYNINKGYHPPSSEDIAKHMDFDSLLEQFGETPAVEQDAPPQAKTRRLQIVAGLAMAAMLIGWLFYINTGSNNQYDKANSAHFAAQDYVNPPNIDVPQAQFASIKINANKGGVYEHRTGSKIVIPKAAFVNDKGALIEGEVDIRYREFHDYVDFFLSGIPMTYDSLGVQYTLESAGMLEVYAEQNGKRVRMAPGKNLDVELVSYINLPQMNKPPKYNIYKLDKEARNWIYTDIDKIQIIEEEEKELDENSPLFPAQKVFNEELNNIKLEENSRLSAIENAIAKPIAPKKPQSTNGSNTVFDLDISEQGELKDVYDNSLWQVSPRSTVKVNEMIKNADGMSLREVNNLDYELTLTAGSRSQKILVNPVLSGTNLENALAKYSVKLAEFNHLMQERQAQLAEEKKALEAEMAAKRKVANANYKDAVAELKSKGFDKAATELMVRKKIINRFTATEFGIWNCDRPLPPDIQLLKANFATNKGKKLNNHTAYLVDKSKNTVNRFLASDDTKFSFNKNSQNLLWIVTEDNKIAVFRDEDFAKITDANGNFTFVLQEIEKHIENEDDVREVLYF